MSETLFWVVAASVVLLFVLFAVAVYRWSRTRRLRKQFGPEYEHAVHDSGGRRAAEHELEQRRRRVDKYPLRDLGREEAREFGSRWRRLQVDFVDRPTEAVEDADRMIVEVMAARGYPHGDFHQRLADTSVSYPEMANEYREARSTADRSRRGVASTEELRRAMVCYRNLFSALIGAEEVPSTGGTLPPHQEVRR